MISKYHQIKIDRSKENNEEASRKFKESSYSYVARYVCSFSAWWVQAYIIMYNFTQE